MINRHAVEGYYSTDAIYIAIGQIKVFCPNAKPLVFHAAELPMKRRLKGH